ncbi:MAG: single-stranded-DNA-specific exonuclease RecJ [Endomicrobiaceae bacterium]
MQQNKWVLQEFNKEKISPIAEKTNLPDIVIKILLGRGISDIDLIKEFVYADKEYLLNPFLLDGMHKAVTRIKQAVEQQERILIYADRDVDGITSLVILFNTIQTLGGDVVWYIPSDEGYGMSKAVLDKYHKMNVKLIITVDCGISSVQEVQYSNELGMQIIVTDHHEPPIDVLPEAYAIVNPKKTTCKYKFKELAGCGISFKVSQALMHTYGKDFNSEILFISLQKDNNGYNSYILKVVNELVIEETAFSFSDDNEKLFYSLLKDKKIVSYENNLFKNLDNVIKFIDLPDIHFDNLKESAYFIFNKYKKERFINDGRMAEFFDNNVDLVALGTIADIVPLISENRILVKNGLAILNANPAKRLGLYNIINEYLKDKNNISAKTISWSITPVLNAAGRMSKADISAELLLADDKHKAEDFFFELKKLNNERKTLQVENVKQFEKKLKQQCDVEKDKIFIVVADNLPHGVTGIAASQIAKMYSRPTILFISDGQHAVGACRSIEGFDIVSALDKTKDLLIKFGGHSQAAGLTVEVSKIEELRKRLEEIAESSISSDMVVKKINIDCELKISDINKKTLGNLMLLEPFGCANPNPVFLIKNVELKEVVVIGQTEEHLKLKISQNGGNSVNAVFWHGAALRHSMQYKDKFDILFNLELNRDSIQVSIIDIKKI